jgi:hypothetical protein
MVCPIWISSFAIQQRQKACSHPQSGMSLMLSNLAWCRDLAWTNLDTCFVFAGLAKRELEVGTRGRAKQAFGRAQCGYESIQRFLSKIENVEHRREVQAKLDELGKHLDFLGRAL